MKLASRILAFVLLALLAFWFTAENSRELVNIDLFLFRVRASLPLVVFGAMLVGMVAVFLVGLRADLRTRRLLGRYREALERLGAGPPPPRAEPGPGERRGVPAPASAASPDEPDEAEDEPEWKEGRSDDRRASTPST